MAADYSDPRFGVEQCWSTEFLGAINGTVAATVLRRMRVRKAMVLNYANINFKVGGTEAGLRQIVIGRSLAGTGTTAQLGSQALGTMADLSTPLAFAVAGTFAAGDDIVVQHLGTGAGVYNVGVQLFLQETFVNA